MSIVPPPGPDGLTALDGGDVVLPGGGRARYVTTTRADGDFRIDAEPGQLDHIRRAVIDRPWVWLRQVHGDRVVTVVGDDARRWQGVEADALVTAAPTVAIAVQTADCAPVVLVADEGVLGVAHAGWRGLVGGVVEGTVDAMRALGATAITARLGPCIGPECYEFGVAELDEVATRYGDAVRALTSQGTPALDLGAGVEVALRGAGVDVVARSPVARGGGPASGNPACTACQAGRWFSHRARGEVGRMATVVWREP